MQQEWIVLQAALLGFSATITCMRALNSADHLPVLVLASSTVTGTQEFTELRNPHLLSQGH